MAGTPNRLETRPVTEQYLELILDGDLTREDVESAVRARAVNDRATKGIAFDSGGWNNLAVLFDHRALIGVETVSQARQMLEAFDLGDGVAVRVRNDADLVPMPAAVLEPRPARPMAVEVPSAPQPEPAALAAQEPAAAAIADEAPAIPEPTGPRFEDSEEAQPLLAKREQAIAKMRGFAGEIIQRLGTQTSKTRGCAECKSQITVSYIKATDGEEPFTTIRCPVCHADNFCIFPTDLAQRERLANQFAKIERQIADARADFDAAHAVEGDVIAMSCGDGEVLADEAGDAETVQGPEPIHDAVDHDLPVATAVPAAVAEAEGLPHPGEPNTFEEDMPPATAPDYVWLVAGYVQKAAKAA
jgi:hypothetical protein